MKALRLTLPADVQLLYTFKVIWFRIVHRDQLKHFGVVRLDIKTQSLPGIIFFFQHECLINAIILRTLVDILTVFTQSAPRFDLRIRELYIDKVKYPVFVDVHKPVDNFLVDAAVNERLVLRYPDGLNSFFRLGRCK